MLVAPAPKSDVKSDNASNKDDSKTDAATDDEKKPEAEAKSVNAATPAGKNNEFPTSHHRLGHC